MKHPFFPSLAVACLMFTLTLGACADHSVADTHRRSNAPSANTSGPIPTRDGRNSQYVAGNTVGGGTGSEYSVPTGSQIPRRYNRAGYTTDAPDPAFVYDHDDIRVQSTNTVGDQLRNVPGVNVAGSR